MTPSLSYYTTLLRKDFTDYCNRRLGEIGLTQGLLFFILYVGKHPDCSPTELSHALCMDVGHTARSLAKLKQAGFLIQEANPTDRRAHTLRLTETGMAAFHMSHELFFQWDAEVLCTLSDGEQELLLSLLEKLVHTEGGAFCVRDHT